MKTRASTAAWAATVALGTASHVCLAAQPELVSRAQLNPAATASASGESRGPILSRDGTLAAFTSTAPNLTTNRFERSPLNVFVLRTSGNGIELVSATPAGHGARGSSHSPALSANGRFVAFVSDASDLSPIATNRLSQVYIRDRETGVTRLVSVDAAGNAAADDDCYGPQLSDDGRRIAFSSRATNLAEADDNARIDIFVRDLDLGVTRRVTTVPASVASRYDCTEYALSRDGQALAFCYPGDGLPTTATEPTRPVSAYLWTFDAALVRHFGVPGAPVGGVFHGYEAHNPAFSADGRQLVVQTAAAGGAGLDFAGGIVRFDTATGESTVPAADVATANLSNTADSTAPAISGDGQTLAFVHWGLPGARNPTAQFGLDTWTAAGGRGGLVAGPPPGIQVTGLDLVLSEDGKRLAFLSTAPLVPAIADTNTWQLYLMDLPSGTVRLVSRDTAGNPVAGMESADFSLDATGSHLVFSTRSAGLAPEDRNTTADVFRYDWDTDSIALLTWSVAGRESVTAPVATRNVPNGLSADGRYVLLETGAANLVSEGGSGQLDFVVADRYTGQRTLVTAPAPGRPPIRGQRSQAWLSANGRHVAFVSNSRDLTPEVTNAVNHVYVRDLDTGELQIASRRRPGITPGALNNIDLLGLSLDARFVFYRVQTLDEFKTSVVGAGYVAYDLLTRTQVLAQAVTGFGIPPVAFAEGGAVVVIGRQPISGASTVFDVFRLAGGPTETFSLIGIGRNRTRLTTDGRRAIAYLEGKPQTQIYYRDAGVAQPVPVDLPPELQGAIAIRAVSPDGTQALVQTTTASYAFSLTSGTTTPLTVNDADQLPEGVSGEQIAADRAFERFIFRSAAASMSPSPLGFGGGLFLRTLAGGTTMELTTGFEGLPFESVITRPAISADGRTAVFTARSDNPALWDFNGFSDVYALPLPPSTPLDSDGDGLDDGWEMAWFGSLGRDGAGDADADGMTEAMEYAAGTAPIDDRSLLRLEGVPGAGGTMVLRWIGVPGRMYQLRTRATLDGAWVPVGQKSIGTGSLIQLPDPAPPGGQRYYQLEVGLTPQ